jgi:hypothetical protein
VSEMPPMDPTSPGAKAAQTPIVIDYIERFAATARAFDLALDRVCSARGPFVTGAADLQGALGDAHAAARYNETFVGMLRTLDALEQCFQQFSRVLAATGVMYQRADDSVADRGP